MKTQIISVLAAAGLVLSIQSATASSLLRPVIAPVTTKPVAPVVKPVVVPVQLPITPEAGSPNPIVIITPPTPTTQPVLSPQ